MENINDKPPEFVDFPEEMINLKENQDNDTLTTISATDPEFNQNDKLELIISNPENNKPFTLTKIAGTNPASWTLGVSGKNN